MTNPGPSSEVIDVRRTVGAWGAVGRSDSSWSAIVEGASYPKPGSSAGRPGGASRRVDRAGAVPWCCDSSASVALIRGAAASGRPTADKRLEEARCEHRYPKL